MHCRSQPRAGERSSAGHRTTARSSAIGPWKRCVLPALSRTHCRQRWRRCACPSLCDGCVAEVSSCPPAAAGDEGLFLGAVGFGYHLNSATSKPTSTIAVRCRSTRARSRRRPRPSRSGTTWAVVFDDAGVPRRALEIYDENCAPSWTTFDGKPPAYLVGNRARALERVGRRREAEAQYHRAFDLAGQQHNVRGQIYCCWAWQLRRRNPMIPRVPPPTSIAPAR